MPRHVVAIVAENADGILACQSQRFMALLQTDGLPCHVLALDQPDFLARLLPLLAEGVAFGWGFAGTGARLTADGVNLWEQAGTPFISVLADPPYGMPANHHVASRTVVNAYVHPDWIEVQRRFVRAPQVSATVPLGVLNNPGRATPWAERQGAVLVKNGADPVAQRANWFRWPAVTRAVLQDSADALSHTGTTAILPTVLDCLAAYGMVLDGRPDLLLGLLHELDSYVSALRATTLVRALRQFPVTVVGAGWDHLSAVPGRASFRPRMAAAAIDPFYAASRTVLNSGGNLSGGVHARVLSGFAAGCRVLSDDNAYSRTHLADMPSFEGVEWHEPDLADRLATLLDDEREPDTAPADAFLLANHDPGVFLGYLARLAELVAAGGHMAPYLLDAA